MLQSLINDAIKYLGGSHENQRTKYSAKSKVGSSGKHELTVVVLHVEQEIKQEIIGRSSR